MTWASCLLQPLGQSQGLGMAKAEQGWNCGHICNGCASGTVPVADGSCEWDPPEKTMQPLLRQGQEPGNCLPTGSTLLRVRGVWIQSAGDSGKDAEEGRELWDTSFSGVNAFNAIILDPFLASVPSPRQRGCFFVLRSSSLVNNIAAIFNMGEGYYSAM